MLFPLDASIEGVEKKNQLSPLTPDWKKKISVKSTPKFQNCIRSCLNNVKTHLDEIFLTL